MILIVDDYQDGAEALCRVLTRRGYPCQWVPGGREALAMIRAHPPEQPLLIVLDEMMPDISGMEVLREIRSKKPKLPILVLTAKGAVDDKVAGLDAGADDYLIKPFAFAELSARIRALLRRGTQENPRLRMADLEIDTAARHVRRGGQTIDLKLKEYALLEFLLRNARRPVTRTMIVEHVWDIHFDSVSNVVDVHINSLRNKIDKGFNPPLIQTVRGVGYMITDHAT